MNLCRRLTVTAAGREIVAQDLPGEFGGEARERSDDWAARLGQWAEEQFVQNREHALLDAALPQFERTLILAALKKAHGKRLEAAKLLGWGRNTLTRKIKELGL
jgi:two-component system nitrogen regulation response regulator GlnG